jgi:hypothetical protein
MLAAPDLQIYRRFCHVSVKMTETDTYKKLNPYGLSGSSGKYKKLDWDPEVFVNGIEAGRNKQLLLTVVCE